MTSPPNLPSPTSAWLIPPLCLPLCFISYLPYLCPAWLYWLVGLACLCLSAWPASIAPRHSIAPFSPHVCIFGGTTQGTCVWCVHECICSHEVWRSDDSACDASACHASACHPIPCHASPCVCATACPSEFTSSLHTEKTVKKK